MLGRKLKQLVNAIKTRSLKGKLNQLEKERTMPMGKGTYGSKKGRPPKAAKKMATPIKKKPIKKKK
jgi:hypothetical protein